MQQLQTNTSQAASIGGGCPPPLLRHGQITAVPILYWAVGLEASAAACSVLAYSGNLRRDYAAAGLDCRWRESTVWWR